MAKAKKPATFSDQVLKAAGKYRKFDRNVAAKAGLNVDKAMDAARALYKKGSFDRLERGTYKRATK